MKSRTIIGDASNQVIVDKSNAKAFILKIRKDAREVSYLNLNDTMESVVKMLSEDEVEALSELYAISRAGEELDFSNRTTKVRFAEYLKGYFHGRFFANTKAKLDREPIQHG